MQIKSTLLLSSLLGVSVARRGSPIIRNRSRTEPLFRRATGEVAQPPAAVSNVTDSDGPGSTNPGWQCYTGNGENGWPAVSDWVSFETMWSGLQNAGFGTGCSGNVGDNSQQETDDVKTAIEAIAAASQVDHRFILAIIMNESSGCVRVKTTVAPQSGSGAPIDNPGLMQDYNGYYTCNCQSGGDQYGENCGLVNPCPQSTISGMVSEGTMGTNAGSGLADLINTAQTSGASGAHTFYMAAELYNAGIGSVSVNGDLSQYAVKVANWVTGWQGASSSDCGGSSSS